VTPRFETLADFLAMGGDAPFVWGAWGLSALVIVALWARAAGAERHWRARMEAAEKRQRDGSPA
jgi:heme exporter protein D